MRFVSIWVAEPGSVSSLNNLRLGSFLIYGIRFFELEITLNKLDESCFLIGESPSILVAWSN